MLPAARMCSGSLRPHVRTVYVCVYVDVYGLTAIDVNVHVNGMGASDSRACVQRGCLRSACCRQLGCALVRCDRMSEPFTFAFTSTFTVVIPPFQN